MMPRRLIALVLAIPVLAGAGGRPGDDPSPPPVEGGEPGLPDALTSKEGYWLLNPTPEHLRRPLSADRPDATESPYPVDVGAVQLEMSFFELGLQVEDGGTRRSLSIAPVNLKVGLTNRVDVQLLFNPYEHERGGGAADADGVGTLGVRTKINLWGGDGGMSAGAIMPFMIFPAGDDDVAGDHVEGGVVLPVAFELPAGWGLGAQIELAAEHDEATDEYDIVLAHTAVLGHDIVGDLAGYIEYIGEVNLDMGDYSPSLSAGLTYALSEDAQLDFGVVVGLDNPDTEDVRLFSGITLRF